MMRMRWIALLSVLATTAIGFGAGPAGAVVEHSGQRLAVAIAAFADPTDCADGSCEGVYVTAATGYFGSAGDRVPLPGIVLVQVAPSTVENGQLYQSGEATLIGCTYDADVAVNNNLRGGTLTTAGSVALREFVQYEDGSFGCGTPNGHSLDARVQMTGIGGTDRTSNSGQYANAWQHEFGMERVASRSAAAEASIVLDGAPLTWPAWPNGGQLLLMTSRGHLIMHPHAVGPTPHTPLVVPAHATLVKVAAGSAGDWNVDAMIVRQGDVGKTSLGLSGMLDGDMVWGDSVPTAITLADDLTTATVESAVTLYRDGLGGPEEVGVVTVRANWVGIGDLWGWTNRGVTHASDGKTTTSMTGIHRDASFTLVLDNTEIAGGNGYLEAFVFKSAPKSL